MLMPEQILVALSNNSLETYSLPSPVSGKKTKSDGAALEPNKTHSLELAGHRQDIRTLCISSDDQVIASAASGTLKIWNAKTTACLRTMECGYAICSTFLPGDRHVSGVSHTQCTGLTSDVGRGGNKAWRTVAL